ncbi:lipid droplet-associated hydrolase [Monodelphis domestica]|uniref:lipid droplet-associated hydrolase n=1 Tax=Monodelphis domestica TaxID=13616 RepID=UPI0024E25304|nr:lipid droplet-associated hydrolase [Monodelphis domestica]XP_056670975.1 lipid droplet-associated hydrolase [Monodelphis domestica]XP_056670984.1 lipid droplet-associated hydrolase [Monodelphis domestica]
MDAPMDEDVPVQEEFLACRGAETQVLKFGPWTDLLRPGSQGSPKLLVLVVAGNPGIPAFYLSFAKALYLTLDKHHPVWVVSHAGHVMAPRGVEVTEESPEDPGPGTTDDVFGLEGQVEHKLAFLRRYVPGSLKLVLIGHSIGAYILLEMMKRAPQLPVLRAFLLFPTIERMAKSPNGRVVTPLLCWLRYALYVPLFIGLSLVPVRFKAMLASMFLQNVDMENSVLARLMNSLNMSCVANAMYLGSQEMRTVLERDNPTIQKHLKKLTFYYGASDLWCPVQYYEDIKKDFPSGDIRLCQKGIHHAFVTSLSSSQEMAAMIRDWLQGELSEL